MRKFLFKAIAIVAIVVVIDFAVGFMSDRKIVKLPDTTAALSMTSQVLFQKTSDILVLGPSTAHHNYNCHIIGDSLNLTAYNAGMNGKDMIYTDIILSEYIKRSKLKYVILDVSPAPFDGGWLGRSDDLKNFYSTSEQVRQYYDNETDFIQRIKLKSALYRYNQTLFTLLIRGKQKKNSVDGFEPLKQTADSIDFGVKEDFVVDSTELRHFVNIVQTCKKNNAKLICVETPYAIRDKAFSKWIEDFCNENQLLFIPEGQKEIYRQHPEWFRDGAHLNEKGTIFFSSSVASQIKSSRL